MLLPKPFPDEAVGGVLLRAQQYYGISLKALLSWIYDVPPSRSNHSFHLSTDVDRIAQLCGMGPRDFLHSHTVFPYVTACLPNEYKANLEAKLLASRHRRPYSIASIVGNVSIGASTRRYCLQCANDDLVRYGETYWHRLHQLPTVLICPDHKTPLVLTGIPSGLTCGKTSLTFPSPDYVRPVKPPVSMAIALTLARLSQDLLSGRYDHNIDWHDFYRARARELGFVHHYGETASGVGSLALSELYGAKYLQLIDCSVQAPWSTSWPALLLRSSRNQFISVVRHLLMQAFLHHAHVDERLRALLDKVVKPQRTDFPALDKAAKKAIKQEILRHKSAGTRTTIGHLLEVAGVTQIYRHNRKLFPAVAAVLTAFRSSDQSARQLGGSAYWRGRTPSRWGLPSKRRGQGT